MGDGSLDDIFNDSLGDFDGQMQREREGMASTGQGSGRAAGQREGEDAAQVRTAGSGGMQGSGGLGGTAGMPGGGMQGGSRDGAMGGAAGGASGPQSGTSAGEVAGAGQEDVQSGLEGGDFDESQRDGAMVGDIPEDIPADGSGEDQVAQQIREAAMAEADPDIREALWDEYRRHMGIKKK